MAAPAPLFSDALSSPAASPPWRRAVLQVILIYLVTRLVIWTAAYTGTIISYRIHFQVYGTFESHWREVAPRLADPNSYERWWLGEHLLDLNPLVRFDARHYRTIVEGGYAYRTPAPGERLEQNIAFFPLYPLTCRPLAGLLGPNVAMVAMSHFYTLAAVLLLYGWLRRRIDHPAALLAVAAVLCWPAGVYTAFGYAESLTLLLFTATVVLLDRQRWWLAAIVCGLATATRPTAAALVPVVLLAYWLHGPGPRTRRTALLVPLGLLAAAGLIGYFGYLWHAFGSPGVYSENFRNGWVPAEARGTWLEYLTLANVWSQLRYWGRVLGALVGFPMGLVELAIPRVWNIPLTAFGLLLCLGGLRRVPPRFRPLLWLGPLTFVQAYLASGGATFGILPIARYMSVVVPAMVVLGAWMAREWSPAARHFTLAGFVVLQACWAFHFTLTEWPG